MHLLENQEIHLKTYLFCFDFLQGKKHLKSLHLGNLENN